jgi:hypothetical protein
MRNLVSAFILVAFVGCGGGSSTGSAGATPVGNPTLTTIGDQSAQPTIGTEWTYQQQVLQGPIPYNGQSGTLTLTFNGQLPYRGANHYSVQAHSSIAVAPDLTSFYQQQSGLFSELAGAFYNFAISPGCNKSPQQEDLLATPVSFTTLGSTQFGETSIRCGFNDVPSSDSIVVSDKGTATTVTPGGIFSTVVRAGVFVTFGQRVEYTDYVAGITVVERDVTFFDANNSVTAITSTKYKTGPLNVAFPGPAMLLAQYN